MANTAGINGKYAGINATRPDPGAPSFVDTQNQPYRLETHSQDGTLLHFLPNWWGGSWKLKTLTPETLTFSYDATNEFVGDFVFPNEVWIYRGDNTTPQQKFIITIPSDSETEGYTIDLECKSLLYQLGKEFIPFYEAATATSISEILGAVLTLQTQTPVIGLGHIDSAIGKATRILKAENKTILEIILDLQCSIGGYFFVDINRRLQWKRTIGLDLGHQIRMGKNVQLVRRKVDNTDLATRMHGYGAGVDKDIRLSVTVNDATAQSAFGIIAARFDDQSITDIDMLTEATTAELNRRKTPRTTYTVGMIDLSQGNSDLDYSFEATALTLGTKVNLIGGLSDVDIYTRVQEITFDLDSPLNVQIAVSNPDAGTTAWGGNEPRQSVEGSFEDLIVELFKALKRGEQDIGILDTILRAMDGGTIENPPAAADRMGSLEQVIWMNDGREEVPPSTDPPKLGGPDKIPKEDAIADAINEVVEAAGTGGHDSDTYDELVTNLTGLVDGITWGGEASSLPTLPTNRPTIVYYNDVGAGDDQLWIGFNGSGTSDSWTPMQFTTSASGGTPT